MQVALHLGTGTVPRRAEAVDLLRHTEEALATADAKHPLLGALMYHAATLHLAFGSAEEGMDYARRSLAIEESLASPDHTVLVQNLVYLSVGLYNGGSAADARDCIQRALRVVSEEHGEGKYCHAHCGKLLVDTSGMLNMAVTILRSAGQSHVAAVFYRQSIELSPAGGDDVVKAFMINNLAQAYYEMGDFDAAAEQHLCAISHARGDDAAAAAFHADLCRTMMAYDDVARVRKAAAHACLALDMWQRFPPDTSAGAYGTVANGVRETEEWLRSTAWQACLRCLEPKATRTSTKCAVCGHAQFKVQACQACHNIQPYEQQANGTVLARKLHKCGRCKAARYCSQACQAADWPTHKALCPRLQQLHSSGGKKQ